MRAAAVLYPIAGLVIFGAGMATGLYAETYADSKQRVELKRADLSGAPNMEVISSIGEYKPGDVLARHSHHGVEAAYVLQGGSVEVPGQGVTKIPTGASFMNLRDVEHAGFKIVGDTSIKFYTVHIVDKGKPLYVYTK